MPVLTPEQLNSLRGANRKLAIFGKLNADPQKQRFVFTNDGTGDACLGAEHFFRLVEPELRMPAVADSQSITIGAANYNQYDLKLPIEGGGQTQKLLIDSPLLAAAAPTPSGVDSYQLYQLLGAKLFRELLTNLDTVVRFSSSKFTRSLLKYAKDYIFDAANNQLRKSGSSLLDKTAWNSLCQGSQRLQAGFVKYLTCCVADESDCLGKVAALLETESAVGKDRVEAVKSAIVQARTTLWSANASDATYTTLLNTAAFRWLDDYPDDPEYGIKIQSVKERGFFAYYRAYRLASDDVHRFVRTQSLRSFVFVWLASKFMAHDSENYPLAAREMYRQGKEEHKENWVSGETLETSERNRRIIMGTESLAEGRAEFADDVNYQTFASSQKNQLWEITRPKGNFNRRRLVARIRALFVKLGQRAGGIGGQLLRESAKQDEELVKERQRILGAKTADLLEVCHKVRDRYSAKATNDAVRSKVEALLDGILKLGSEPEPLRQSFEEACMEALSLISTTAFDEAWRKNRGQIDADAKYLGELADLRLGANVVGQRAEKFIPGFQITSISIPDTKLETTKDKNRRQQELEQEAQTSQQARPPIKLSVPRPQALPTDAIGLGNIVVAANQIATVDVQDRKIEIAFPPNVDAKQVLSEDAELNVAGKSYRVVNLAIRDLQTIPQLAPPVGSPVQVAEKHDLLSKKQDEILGDYLDLAKGDNELQRGFRAMTFAEYLYEAPDGSIDLITDDLSNINGVLIDTVEHAGEMSLGGKLYDNAPTVGLTSLRSLNLSENYPVVDGDQMSSILQYHYELCTKVKNISTYLGEVADLRDFFDIIRKTDLQVTFYNQTLGEHFAPGQVQNLFCVKDPPLVVFLTSQADAAAGLSTFGNRLARAITDTANAKLTQVPIFVASRALDGPLNGLAPIITVAGLPLPELLPADGGAVAGITALNVMLPQGIQIAGRKLRFSSQLLLAASLLLPNEQAGAFGTLIGDWNDEVVDQTNANAGIHLEPQQPVATFLRRIWLEPTGKLLGQVIYTKWLNFFIQAKRSGNPIDAGASLTGDFARRIATWYADPARELVQAFDRLSLTQPLIVKAVNLGALSTVIPQNANAFGMDDPLGASLDPNNIGFEFKDVTNWTVPLKQAIIAVKAGF